VLLNNMLFVARTRAADFIVGRLFGASALGFFSLGLEISNMPSTELTAPINRAVFPGYSALSRDDGGLRRGFLKVIAGIVLITLPAAIGIALVAKPLVLLVLGEKWIDTAPLIQILAFYGLVGALHGNFGYVFIAFGRPRFISLWSAVMLVSEVVLVVAGAREYGLRGAALGLLIGVVLPLPFVTVVLSRMLRLQLSDWLRVISRPVLGVALMSACVVGWAAIVPTSFGTAFALATEAAIGALAYAVGVIVLWQLSGKPDGPEAYVLEKLLALWRNDMARKWRNADR
jgi:lipopolysaccharide exporter